MNPFTHEFHTAASDVRLTGAERRHIHAALLAAMRRAPVPSPYWNPLFAPRFAIPAFVAFILVVTSGTAFAAQGALPGDVLYPIKVSVTEPIQGALAISPAAKANWNAEVATTRLDEARTLAAKGSLTATTSAELALNFSQHASALPDADAAEFSSLVSAKSSAILDAGEGSGSATSTKASGTLVLAIADHPVAQSFSISDTAAPAAEPVVMPMMAPAMMKRSIVMEPEATTSAAEVADNDAFVLNLSIEAHDALADATSTIANGSFDASTTAVASDKADALASLVVKAEAERAVGSTTEAVADFRQALHDAANLHLLLTGQPAATDVPSSEDDDSHIPFPI